MEAKEPANAENSQANKPDNTEGDKSSATMSLKRTKTGEEEGKELTVKSVTQVDPKLVEENKDAKKFPKRKLAMIVGYNGSEF